jgi:hypothetical protein
MPSKRTIALFAIFFIFSACEQNNRILLKQEAAFQKVDIDKSVDKFTSKHDYDSIIKNVLSQTAVSYKPEVISRLKRFLLASEDIAKGTRGSQLIKNLNYPTKLSETLKVVNNSDDVAIILDTGFSDTILTYAKDVLAYYEMGKDGHLQEKKLDLVLPKWAWYLYELQAEAASPFRVLTEIGLNGVKFHYPSFNLVHHTNYLDLLKKHNGKEFFGVNNNIIYDRQPIDESAYHGAMLAYTLKEWAPSAKLILVRYDLANTSKENEYNMLKDLDVIAEKFKADFLIRSSANYNYWYGLNKKNLLKNVLVINCGLDIPERADLFVSIEPLIKQRNNFILANTFSTGCSGVNVGEYGMTYTNLMKHYSKIKNFSFYCSELTESMLKASTVFVDRHSCWNQYNYIHLGDHKDKCVWERKFFSIGFRGPGDLKKPCSVEPTLLAGDSSSAAPLVAAWAAHVKKRAGIKTMTAKNASVIREYINGYRYPGQRDPYVFQDPIRFAEFPIFEEGYGHGLIIPKNLPISISTF